MLHSFFTINRPNFVAWKKRHSRRWWNSRGIFWLNLSMTWPSFSILFCREVLLCAASSFSPHCYKSSFVSVWLFIAVSVIAVSAATTSTFWWSGLLSRSSIARSIWSLLHTDWHRSQNCSKVSNSAIGCLLASSPLLCPLWVLCWLAAYSCNKREGIIDITASENLSADMCGPSLVEWDRASQHRLNARLTIKFHLPTSPTWCNVYNSLSNTILYPTACDTNTIYILTHHSPLRRD